MRVLLIGGSGFIGSHVQRTLAAAGHELIVFHRGTHPVRNHRAREVLGDRCRLRQHAHTLRAVRPDVVIDCVLSSGTQARELMNVFRGATSRIVALSSCDVYRASGITHGLEEGPLEPLPLTETSALRSRLQTYPPAQIHLLQQIFGWLDDEYDKIPVEREILGDAELPGTVLRLPMVYGPGDPLHRFHPIVKRIVDRRGTIVLSNAMAGWRATKGYVEDVAVAIALAATSDRAAGAVFNAGEPDTLTELEWAEAIATAMGWQGRFVLVDDEHAPAHLRARGNTAQHWVVATTRLRETLAFREVVSRDDAVRRTVEWERANPPTGFSPHEFDYAEEDAALDPR